MIKLYSTDKTKQIDQLAAQYLGVNSFELMQLAGAAVYQHIKQYQHILVITGPGNNGGDGFVIAELARKQGQVVSLMTLRSVSELSGDARLAAKLYQGKVFDLGDFSLVKNTAFEVVVDAMFGTGLTRTIDAPYKDVIYWLNRLKQKVIAVDIPSGLNGDTGQIEGVAVKATETISILAQNRGLYTNDGRDCCGNVSYETLQVPSEVYQSINHCGELLQKSMLSKLTSRPHNSHKGQFGDVLAAGGQKGMLGAVLLAAKASLKSGAGSVTVVTEASHADSVALYLPELMSQPYGREDYGAGLLQLSVDKTNTLKVLLCGMGLGRSQWSKQLFKSCLKSELPLVLDADGLNLLASVASIPDNLKVITPHPKEAATLLKISVDDVQNNRWYAVKLLAQKYQCIAVLKGSGTLVSDGSFNWCCPYGNANLATAGSGDVLAGMVAGFMAQGFGAKEAAQMSVLWHAICGEYSEYGLTMTASDLLNTLHLVLYQKYA